MSQSATKVRVEDLDIKPYLISKLKMTGIQSIFDLAISIPHQLVAANICTFSIGRLTSQRQRILTFLLERDLPDLYYM